MVKSKAKIIDGKSIAAEARAEVAERVSVRASTGLSQPGLATVLVGDDPASDVYVRMKQKACDQIGIASFDFRLPEDTKQDHMEELIADLNGREDVHGILMQLPLPAGLDVEQILQIIKIEKDVDEVSEVAGAITPVPGGVGPLTIAMLLKNTLRAAELSDN